MLFIIIFLITLFLFYHFYYKRLHLPPGPLPLPLLGNLGSLAGESPRYDVLLEWQRKYGNAFTFWFSEIPIVMVCDYKLIQDTFIKNYSDELSSKFVFADLMERIRGGTYGIVETSGDLWREQRRFSLSVLRNFGLGKNLMEQKILDEVEIMIKDVKKHAKDGTVCNIINVFDIRVGSVINNLIFGYRFENDTINEFLQLKKMMTDLFIHINTPTNLICAIFYSILRHIPPFKQSADKSAKLTHDIFNFLDKQIKEHESNLDLNNPESVDFCEEYLKEMDRQKGNNYFTKEQLRNICMDLWAAGLETTSTTCQFGVIYLLNHPNVYQKIKKEISDNIDNDRLITLEDKANLQYFQAFLTELQRMVNITLINSLRLATKDVNIDGYLIKAGTVVTPQISNVLYDEKIFPNPFTFNPDRFIDENGKFKKMDEMVQFGIGKRQCLGEGLARMEIFLFLSNLIKHFEISPEHENPPSMNKKWGLTVQPTPFKIRVRTSNN